MLNLRVFLCSSRNLLSSGFYRPNPRCAPFSNARFQQPGNATQNPEENPLLPPNIYGPISRVKFLDRTTSVRQHVYEFLPQLCFSFQLDGPYYVYSAKLVSFFLDQYLSDPRHHWPGSDDDLIVIFIDYSYHSLACLQRKKRSLCFRTSSLSISLVSSDAVGAQADA